MLILFGLAPPPIAESGFPPPFPSTKGEICLIIFPALKPLETADLPQIESKTALPEYSVAKTATTESSLSLSESPIFLNSSTE